MSSAAFDGRPRLERKGHRVLSEREIAAIERAEDKRIYSAERHAALLDAFLKQGD